ncbi:hypothetical protein HNR42_001213 [Deinobacterium chartae]|uniref:Uncharacterized protein n=1 Tax=Deinobacterium chartae TaxID=521158 RepID=A0A841I012_9DEIO|nr:hypothetical protein [Deinobacterium chartae]MBB6097790.1 hypothetical protein [Deinobacterium chartae]
MNGHRGSEWQAELATVALEEGSKKLSHTHPRLFAELNLTPGHFARLLPVVRDLEDARRLAGHPNVPADVRQLLEARFGRLEP